MSAYIAQKKNDRVVILSDAAYYDRDLIIRRISSKIEEIGHFNSVMVSRGDMDLCVKLLHGIRQMWQAADHFDIAIVALEQQLNRLDIGGDQRPLEFILAGVSETGGPMLFAWTNRKVDGIEPFILHRIENTIQCGFVPAGEHLAAFEAKGGIDGMGLEMMELSRRVESEPLISGSRRGHVVGGFVERADITASGISKATIKDWHDRVGFPISIPAADVIAA
jgi:hypothetical protein